MDIIRNVGVRETCGDTSVKSAENLHHRYSLPNITFKETEHIKSNRQALVDSKASIISHQANANQSSQLSKTFGRQYTVSEPQEDECAVSGRLEIRVLPQEQSPNPEESIYFDAMTNGGGAVVNIRSDIIETKSSKSKNTSAPVVPSRDTVDKKPSIFRTASQTDSQMFNRSQSDVVVKPLIKAKPTVDQINSKIQEIELSRSLALNDVNKANPNEPVIEKQLSNIDPMNKKTHIDTTNKREFPLIYTDDDVPSTEFPRQMPLAMTTDCSVSSQGPVAGISPDCFGVAAGQRMTMSHSQSSSCGAANVDGSLNKKERDGSSSSRIPILNPNLRISKCASWAGGECPHSPEIQDLTPGKLMRPSSLFGFVFPTFFCCLLSDLHVVF